MSNDRIIDVKLNPLAPLDKKPILKTDGVNSDRIQPVTMDNILNTKRPTIEPQEQVKQSRFSAGHGFNLAGTLLSAYGDNYESRKNHKLKMTQLEEQFTRDRYVADMNTARSAAERTRSLMVTMNEIKKTIDVLRSGKQIQFGA